jgi:plastocyanin
MNLPSFALRRGALLGLLVSTSLALAACGGTAASPSEDNSAGGTVAVVNGAVDIGADDLAFEASVIQATAGESFTVTLNNNDSVPHNFSVYTEEGGEAIAQGDIIGEGETDEIEIGALEPGEYYFVCDLHTGMNGTIVVEG